MIDGEIGWWGSGSAVLEGQASHTAQRRAVRLKKQITRYQIVTGTEVSLMHSSKGVRLIEKGEENGLALPLEECNVSEY